MNTYEDYSNQVNDFWNVFLENVGNNHFWPQAEESAQYCPYAPSPQILPNSITFDYSGPLQSRSCAQNNDLVQANQFSVENPANNFYCYQVNHDQEQSVINSGQLYYELNSGQPPMTATLTASPSTSSTNVHNEEANSNAVRQQPRRGRKPKVMGNARKQEQNRESARRYRENKKLRTKKLLVDVQAERHLNETLRNKIDLLLQKIRVFGEMLKNSTSPRVHTT